MCVAKTGTQTFMLPKTNLFSGLFMHRAYGHGLPFSLGLQALILPQNEVIGHSSQRLRIFGQHSSSGDQK